MPSTTAVNITDSQLLTLFISSQGINIAYEDESYGIERRAVSLKYTEHTTRLHGVVSHKPVTFVLAAVRI
jgi:hypothetical protein